MTIAITIKRADNNPDHDAEVRVYDVPANSTGHEKTLGASYPLKPDGSVTVNIWSTRTIEVHEVAKATDEPAAS
jgi:hypothetical protein